MEGLASGSNRWLTPIGSSLLIECDVATDGAVESLFNQLAKAWPEIDFVVHALAYSDKAELKGAYLDTSHDNFINTMMVSAYSFTEVARAALQ